MTDPSKNMMPVHDDKSTSGQDKDARLVEVQKKIDALLAEREKLKSELSARNTK